MKLGQVMGAGEFYLFVPGYDADAGVRARAAEFVGAFNRAFLARQVPRNRMSRARR